AETTNGTTRSQVRRLPSLRWLAMTSRRVAKSAFELRMTSTPPFSTADTAAARRPGDLTYCACRQSNCRKYVSRQLAELLAGFFPFSLGEGIEPLQVDVEDFNQHRKNQPDHHKCGCEHAVGKVGSRRGQKRRSPVAEKQRHKAAPAPLKNIRAHRTLHKQRALNAVAS